MLKTILEATESDYELILLKDKNINPCNACEGCYQSHKCIINDDMQEIKVYAINSNPEAEKDELIQLGKRLIS